MPAPRILGASTALALAVVFLTACASSPEQPAPDETTTATSPAPPAPEPSSTPDPEPASEEEPTCDTLIDEAVVADFESVGWSVRAEPLYIGNVEMTGGLNCVWADFESPAGDHGQMFGWATVEANDATALQTDLVTQGWVREQTTEGVYITEGADTAISVDEDGYGMTYLFGDGWVKFADTKQGLLLIEWPAG